MARKGQIRKEILNKVGKFYQQTKNKEKFVPGKTFVNYAGRVYDEKEIINLVDASLDFWLTSGRYAKEFEKKLAGFLGVKYCLLTNSGSSANLLAISTLTSPLLKEKQLKPGDEVITTACGFPTTLNPIIQNNLLPVFIDVELGSYNINPDLLEKAVSKKTKAIFVPHTLGNPVNIRKILKIAKKYNLWFIEDNCIDGDRCSVVRIDDKIQILTIKEIYNVFHGRKYKSFEILSHGDILKENNICNLSDEFMNMLSKRQLNIVNLYKKYQKNSNKIVAELGISKASYYCSMWEIRKKMKETVTTKHKWSNMKNVIYKGKKNVTRITQNFGQTSITNDHRLMAFKNGKFTDKYTHDFINGGDRFINLLLTHNTSENTLDLATYLAGYSQNNGRIKYDENWIWFDYNKKSWKGKISELPKLKRYYKNLDLEMLCALFGLFCSEGSCGHEVRFSSTDYNDIKMIVKYMKSISNLKYIRVSTVDDRNLNKIIRGKEFKNNKIVYSVNMGHELINIFFSSLGGTDSYNKRVPNFVFNLDKKYMKVFYNYYIKGDGCRKSNNETDFVITTASTKMAAGINLLNNLIFKKYSRFVVTKGKYYDVSPVKSLKYLKKKVNKIKNFKNIEVYDIVVDNTSTFPDACGNVLLHNCDSLGSKYKGKYTGSFGHISTCSFYPAHHMSCSKNTQILFLDGNKRLRLERIDKIYERYVSKPNNIKVLSFNEKNNVEWSISSAILRHKLGSKKMVKITSEHGREVEVTEDHSIFVLDKDTAKVIPKFAKQIKTDDYIVATNSIPCPRTINYVDILDYFKKRDAYVSNFSHANLKYVNNADYRWQFKSRNTLPIKYLKEYNLKTDNLEIGISQSYKIPARIGVNKELCRLIGYFIAEGSYQNGLVFSFNIVEKDLIEDVQRVVKLLFNLPVMITKIKNTAVNVEINSKNLEIVFKEIFAIEGKADKKRIPWFIYHSKKGCINSFIYGYTRGDGSIRRMKDNTNRIDVTSVSKELLNDFQYLLSRVEISASFYRRNVRKKKKIKNVETIGRENYSLSFSGYIYRGKTIIKQNIKNKNNISLQIPLLPKFREYISVSKNQKTISRVRLAKYLKSNKELYSLVTSDISFLKVRSIQKISYDSDEYVYDISVPEKENFYGGFLGVFLHNTMGEGGAVLTNNTLLKKIILSFRDWGRDCFCEPGCDNTCGKRFSKQFGKLPFGYDHKYVYSHIGYNLKVTDMQAAIGCAQLEKLPGFIEARKKNFTILYDHLEKFSKFLILPKASEGSDPSWFGFPILVKHDAPFSRADIVNYLENNKVATRMLFGGNLTKQPAYKNIKHRIVGGLKNTNLVMDSLFWIGVYPGIIREKMEYMKNIFTDYLLSKKGEGENEK